MKKWLNDETLGKDRKKREEHYKKLSKDEQFKLKKKKIKEITQNKEKKSIVEQKSNTFLNDILRFKDWLNERNYLQGDLDKIETWIKNLYKKMELQIKTHNQLPFNTRLSNLKKEYNTIPPNFVDEKIRIAINKKIRKTKRTSSDNYYLRKLKGIIKEKLKEAEYYEILRKVVEF